MVYTDPPFNTGRTQTRRTLVTTGAPDRGYPDYMVRALRSLQPTARTNVVGAYDNSGYVMLGKVVKHVTGMDLETYAQRHLFGPMGMRWDSQDIGMEGLGCMKHMH